MTPRVTVITAAYNCSRALAVTIQTVLAQTMRDFEYHVVGDGCTDDSESVVRRFADPRLHWTNLPGNSGSQSAPNNEGLRRARGEYIAYVGQDDLWWPDHLERLLAHIEATGADLVHAVGAYMTPHGPDRVVSSNDLSDVHAHKSPSMWLHRRAVADVVGPWPDHRGLTGGIDDEYFLRIVRSRHRVSQCPHLTALKFPAAVFRIYAATGRLAQEDALERLSRDPEGFRQAVLAVTPKAGPAVPRWRQMLGGAFRRLEGGPVGSRGLLKVIRVAWHTRRWRRARLQAGLSRDIVRRTSRY